MASYEGGNKTQLKERRESYSALVREWQNSPDLTEVEIISNRLRSGLGLVPFNWQV